jgi:digeranylgeranylglycerophospholipid reductase
MKVAIIGGGIAGLACAHEFERLGITPVIYERNSFIGEQYDHVSAILEILNRPYYDPIKYFRKNLHIKIKPINTLKQVIHYSPNNSLSIKGNLGHLFLRGKEKNSFKNQLYAQLKKTKVRFNEIGDYKTLSQQYDYVVVANGSYTMADELGCWENQVVGYVKGAIVHGRFDPHTLITWLNKDYCKNGYAYLTPFNEKKASIILITTDVNEKEIKHFWELFMYTEKIKYPIIEEYTQRHTIGHVYPHSVDNIYLAGSAGGCIEPFLGFGQMAAMHSGVMAARAIAKNKEYEKLMKLVVERNQWMTEYRRAYNELDNKSLDRLLTVLGMPVIRQFMYNTSINVGKYGSMILSTIPKKKEIK